MEEFTLEDEEKLTEEICASYTVEQLKSFIARCYTERMMLVFSTDYNASDGKNMQRRELGRLLVRLQELAERVLASRKQ